MKIPEGFQVEVFDGCNTVNPKTFYGPTEIPKFPELNNQIESMIIKNTDYIISTPMCCRALTKECMACAQNLSVDEFCERHPAIYGCPEMEIYEPKGIVTFYEGKNLQGGAHGFSGVGKFGCDHFKRIKYDGTASSIKVPAGSEALLFDTCYELRKVD